MWFSPWRRILRGRSGDAKPSGLRAGTKFVEEDTGIEYTYDPVMQNWKKKVAPYSALVAKDGSTVWAEDASGKTIASGEAGVDDASVIQSAIDYLPSYGGKVFIRAGIYYMYKSIDLSGKDSITLEGENRADVHHDAGTMLWNKGTEKALIYKHEESYGSHHVLIKQLRLCGGNQPQHLIDIFACMRVQIESCSLSHVPDPYASINADTNELVWIINNDFQSGALTHIYLYGCHTPIISFNSLSAAKYNIFIRHTGSHTGIIAYNLISDAEYDGIYMYNQCSGFEIIGNKIFDNGDNGIRISQAVRNVNIIGNSITGSGRLYTGAEQGHGILIRDQGDGCSNIKIYGNTITGNKRTGIGVYDNSDYIYIIGNTIEDNSSFNIESIVGEHSVVKYNVGYTTENSGTATFSGDGTTTQFTIAHGLVSTPTKVLVTPMTADAASDFYVTADDTNIYINYKSAPPSGTDNLKFSWHAEV